MHVPDFSSRYKICVSRYEGVRAFQLFFFFCFAIFKTKERKRCIFALALF